MHLPRLDATGATRLLRRAIDLGINHIDTAGYYGRQTANEYLRAALEPYPEDLVIVSKVGYRHRLDGSFVPAQRPADLRAGVEADLESLGLDQLGVVNLRLEDGGRAERRATVDLDDQLAEMTALRDEGLIGDFGISNVGLEQLGSALDAHAVCCQNAYSVLDRRDETLLELCSARGAAWVPYFPLGGASSGHGVVTTHPTVVALAKVIGATPAQVGLAWLLHRAANVLLIPGTSDLEHLAENVATASVKLAPRDVAALDALGPPPN